MLVQTYTTDISMDEFLTDARSVMSHDNDLNFEPKIFKNWCQDLYVKVNMWHFFCGVCGHWRSLIERGTFPKMRLDEAWPVMGRLRWRRRQVTRSTMWRCSAAMTFSRSFGSIQVCQDAGQMMNQPASLRFLWQSNAKHPKLHDAKYRHRHHHRTIKQELSTFLHNFFLCLNQLFIRNQQNLSSFPSTSINSIQNSTVMLAGQDPRQGLVTVESSWVVWLLDRQGT